MDQLLDTGRFDFATAYNSAAWAEAMEHPEEHEDPEVLEYDIQTFVYRRRKPFDAEKFRRFVETEWPDEVVRAKGMLWADVDPDMCYVFEQAGREMRMMENGLFVDSAPEDEKAQMLADNPELAEDWDPVCGDRETRLCIIGRHMDPAKVTAQLDELLCDWTPGN